MSFRTLRKKLGLQRAEFAASGAAPIAPEVLKFFMSIGVPLFEAYGMTEATHQMTSNPLPPEQQKAGFVGKPAGPEVCIMDASGKIQPNGVEGEVCIKGDNVTKGYENNEEANKSSFIIKSPAYTFLKSFSPKLLTSNFISYSFKSLSFIL